MTPGLLLLHALPLDGAMWAGQRGIAPCDMSAPTLYGFGERIEAWAGKALETVTAERLVVVGCSVGGSCALEVAALAPDRVSALVLIGTKARHRPDPALHRRAIDMIRDDGPEAAWRTFWRPLFSPATPRDVVERAKSDFLARDPSDVMRGIDVFHSRPSRDDVLSQFPGPVVVVTGADDTAPGHDVSAAQALAAPQGRLHVVPACGHYVPLEKPEALNAILGDLLAELR
ncbi:UNVERIFIED_ORG: alpha/beta hydrolase [Roseateles sp. XES5]|nr:alpha/beta hydrolase [Roseateles sp. XES5]